MSVTEIALIRCRAGEEQRFRPALRSGLRNVVGQPGWRGHAIYQGIEETHVFSIHIKWDSVDAHEAFRRTSAFHEYHAAISALLRRTEFAHYRLIEEVRD